MFHQFLGSQTHADDTSLLLISVYRVFFKLCDAFGSVHDMRIFYETKTNRKSSYNFCDFDWNVQEDSVHWKNMLLIIMSAQKKVNFGFPVGKHIERMMKNQGQIHKTFKNTQLKQDDPQNEKFMHELLGQLMICCSHDMRLFPMHNHESFFAVFTHPALMHMSFHCDGNVITSLQNQKEIVWIVTQPIPAGGRLYMTDGRAYQRRYEDTYVKCSKLERCIPCRDDWTRTIDCQKVVDDYRISSKRFFGNEHIQPKTVTNLLKHLNECFKIVNKKFKGYEKDPKVRQVIVSKKEEILMNLIILGNSFLSSELYVWEYFNPFENTAKHNRIDLGSLGPVSLF